MANELNIPGFKHYELDSTYQAKLAAGEVNAKDLSFVKETGKIYTQGGEYGGGDVEIIKVYAPPQPNSFDGLTESQIAENAEAFTRIWDSANAGKPFLIYINGVIHANNIMADSNGSFIRITAPLFFMTNYGSYQGMAKTYIELILVPDGRSYYEEIEDGSGNHLEVRELKMNDDMTVTTDEQKAYNIETYNKAQAGEAVALSVMGIVLNLGFVASTAVQFSLLIPNPFIINRELICILIALFDDGTFNVGEFDYCTRDTEMSDESENAVQNKVVKKYIDEALANAGGGSGECVADKVVRTLFGMYEELTDELRAYNVETYQMFFSGVIPPLVIVGPFNAEYNLAALPSSGEPVSLTMKNIERESGIILLQNVTLNSDGSVVGGAATVVPINCNLNEPQYARIYFTVGKDIEECNPCILGENGMRYFIDASHASNSESSGYLMEYNTFEKRYRILIDPSTYAITSTEEISFGGSGGGGVSEDYVNTAIANAITTTLNTAV